MIFPKRASLNQIAGFYQHQQQQQPYMRNNYMQSTTLTTTSGLGSNFTSYTTDPIDSSSMSSLASENKLQRSKINPNIGTSSSFLESDLAPDEYLFIPQEGERPQLISPRRIAMAEYEYDYGGN